MSNDMIKISIIPFWEDAYLFCTHLDSLFRLQYVYDLQITYKKLSLMP